MEAGGVDGVEVTEAGLREGVFFERHLAAADPPLFDDVRAATRPQPRRAVPRRRPARRARRARSRSSCSTRSRAAGLHAGDPAERELLWAAAMLHDVGMAVDYDDHHKHSRYLILNGGLPGFSPRETALIAQIARYHRKGDAGFGELEPLDASAATEERARARRRAAAPRRVSSSAAATRSSSARSVERGRRRRVRLHLVSRADADAASRAGSPSASVDAVRARLRAAAERAGG